MKTYKKIPFEIAKDEVRKEQPIEIAMGGELIVIFGDTGEIPNYLQLRTPTINFSDVEIRQNLRREIRDLILDFVIRNGKPKIL